VDCGGLSPYHCLSVTKEFGYNNYHLKNIKYFTTRYNGFKSFVKFLTLKNTRQFFCSVTREKLFDAERKGYIIRSEYYTLWSTRLRSWLRHYATSEWSQFRFTMTSWNFSVDLILPAALCPLGSTQPLTEMSTRNLPEGKWIL
jgi:hypothetical protein